MRLLLSPLAALAFIAGTADAQTIGTGDQPRCFFWETSPAGWDDDEFDERFVPMIRIDIASLSGEDAALAVKAGLAALCTQFPANATFIRNHVSILLQNFGTEGQTKFALENVQAPAQWPDELGPQKPENHPWLNTGVENAKEWVEEFIAELSNGADAVTPFRFHFDSEFQLCGYSNENEVALAFNVFDTTGTTNGGRWNDTDWKIPLGDPSALTLKQHWDAALIAYSAWPSDPQEMLTTEEPPNAAASGDTNNRAFFLWYQRILDLAVEGGMKECAYDLILAEWPSCEISNYEFTNIDQPLAIQTADVFGWQFDFSTVNSTFPDPADSFVTRELPLGYFKATNASYGHEVSGTYFITPGNYRLGTMNAPVLYSVGTVHHTNAWSEVIQRNLYEPHEDACDTVQSGDCDAPIETHWQAAMRTHRHWLESILLSGDGPETIGPWVTIPGQGTYNPQAPSADDISRQLCMLRAKSIPELLVWNDPGQGDPEDEWPEFMNIYKRVYTPSLDDITLIDGTVVPGSAISLERARRTLFDSNDLPHVISIASATVGSDEVTSMDFFFDDMSAHSGQDLRIILETTVVPDEALEPGLPPIFGNFYLWDPDLADWLELSCPDHAEVSAVPDGSFGYYTPDYSGRRVFDFKDCRIREIGETSNQITIRVVHTSADPFKTQHDLVQVLWAGEYTDCNCTLECEEEEGPENAARGADFDYSRIINSTDAAAFDAAYSSEQPAADLNRDGLVNETDQVLFAERFGG